MVFPMIHMECAHQLVCGATELVGPLLLGRPLVRVDHQPSAVTRGGKIQRLTTFSLSLSLSLPLSLFLSLSPVRVWNDG